MTAGETIVSAQFGASSTMKIVLPGESTGLLRSDELANLGGKIELKEPSLFLRLARSLALGLSVGDVPSSQDDQAITLAYYYFAGRCTEEASGPVQLFAEDMLTLGAICRERKLGASRGKARGDYGRRPIHRHRGVADGWYGLSITQELFTNRLRGIRGLINSVGAVASLATPAALGLDGAPALDYIHASPTSLSSTEAAKRAFLLNVAMHPTNLATMEQYETTQRA